MDNELGRVRKDMVMGLFMVLLTHLPGRTEGHHDRSQAEHQVSWPKFKPGICII
jgi:hypothetical protein